MPLFCVNLTMLYNERDFPDRFAAAAADGFAGVEYLFPYSYVKEDLAGRLKEHDLVQVLHNLPASDWAAGEINYPFIFAALDEAGYNGWVGCEYKPATTTAAGLGWFAPYRRSAA